MTKKRKPATVEENTFGESFHLILMNDVLLSMERVERADTQTSRRDLIRTTFAAIEGYVWQYRSHVRFMVETVSEIPPIMALALAEATYVVSETGKLSEQTRFVSLTAMIRLVTRLAEANCAGLKIDFSDQGWSNVQQAIDIRNRITHPKNHSDLTITDEDIEISRDGFFWLIIMMLRVMQASVDRSSHFLDEFTKLLGQLKSGDPAALADYRKAFASIQN
jgi:hypothetical protein